MKKYLSKICIFLLTICSLFTFVSVNASSGYTYDHKGNVISSTEGFTVNETPYIYNSMGLTEDLISPSDLLVYKEETGDVNNPYKTIIYMLDAGNIDHSSVLYMLNDRLQVTNKIDKLILDPTKFSDGDLLKIKSNRTKLLDLKGVDNQKLYETVDDIKNGGIIELKMSNATSIFRMHKLVSLPYTDYLYICDQENNQILVLDTETFDDINNTYEVVQVITTPEGELGKEGAPESITFKPNKVTVDDDGRVYCTAENVSNGIMQFSLDGSFLRYVGTNKVTLTAWQIFWRNLASDEQLKSQQSILPTTFASISYKGHMIYATSSAYTSNGALNTSSMIKKINPTGKDVLRRNGYQAPSGDIKYNATNDKNGAYGPSTLVGITINDYGVYTVVDSKRGRLFTYDNEGNLLYISGSNGEQLDKISNPTAIQYFGEDILVLDKNKKAIIKFETTDIAKVINKAVECEYHGRNEGSYDEHGNYIKGAYDYWEEVVSLNSNYEYAYVGIGRHYMKIGQYKKAMNYFKLGFDMKYYGKAFKLYRDGVIKKGFVPFLIVVVVLVAGGVTLKYVMRKKKGYVKDEETGIGDE